MQIQSLIQEARNLFFSKQAQWTLPMLRWVLDTSDYTRASSLGRCALKAGLEKVGVEPDYPNLTIAGNESTQWIVDHGNYNAPMIQLPMLYYATQTPNLVVKVEEPAVSSKHKLSGKYDMYVEYRGEAAFVEIKDREGFNYRSVGLPKLSDCYQVLAYGLYGDYDANSVSYYICTVSKWGFHCYLLKPEGKGFIVIDETTGNAVPEDWNTPENINFDAVKKELAHQRTYFEKAMKYKATVDARKSLLAEGDYELRPEDVPTPTPPIPTDALLDRDTPSWQCASMVDKGTYDTKKEKGRPAKVVPNCPYAKMCHGLEQEGRYAKKLKDANGNPSWVWLDNIAES